MAQIVYSENALANLERAFAFLVEHEPTAAATAVTLVQQPVEMLADHPLIGRRIVGELRELVISFGSTGYVALYRFVPERDLIRILALRHQRELDYPV